jgi:membrane protease YdiL (CAAX protease family)
MVNPARWKLSATIYCSLVFVLSWSLWIVAGRSGDSTLELTFLSLHLHLSQESVLVMLGNLAPGFIAVIMRLPQQGRAQVGSFPIQIRPAKSPKLLYVFAVLAPLAINLTMFLTQENLSPSALASLRLGNFIRLFGVNILLAPLWEEIGWRGYLLPMLSKQIGLGRASLLVGFVWGSWHFALYRYVFRAPMNSFLISFGVIVAMAVVLAVLYSASGNTLLLPILFHTSWNAATNWVIGAEPRYDLGPIMLQAISVWILAGAAWLYYRRLRNEI